ncbi:MAG: hypothetical protein LBR41_01120 [Rickettsiales bacterium]|jgi:NTP pyrophosphatase (non-canonical NTP hydrolase)|nr:hypothetical protein [Rickettsiales bacterium]
MKAEHRKILTECVAVKGISNRRDIAVEEMAELIKELSKNGRGEDNRQQIIEEMADVYVTLNGLRVGFCIRDLEIDEVIEFKMKRLADRLERWKNDAK